MDSNITLNQIRTDGGTQARAGLNEETVAEYLQAMKEGGNFPPVNFPPLIVFYDGQDYWLADGFHRLEAMKRWGVYRPGPHRLDIRQGTQRDAVLFACGANATHGLKRSNEDKRRAVQRLLQDEEWATWADREIARRCNVSAPFVGQMRAELGVVVDERVYTTKHGTVATMAVAEKASPPPEEKMGGQYKTEPPDGYVACDEIGLYSLCPTCGHKGKMQPNRPPRFSGYESCQESRCSNCGHEFLKLSIDGVFRSFHLPNSGRKPEVEIGGQEEFQPPFKWVLLSQLTTWETCVTCGAQKSDEWESRNIYLPNSHICREMLCLNCGHKYLVVQLHINDEPHLVPCYHLPNSGAVVDIPAEYKNWPRIKRIIEFENGDKCPNCGKYGNKIEQRLSLDGYDYSWISTCQTCFHHQLIFGVNNGHRFRFHTPPLKNEKPEVKIGGQDIEPIGGQEDNEPENKYFQAILYLEKLMRSDATSEVDPEGVLLDEIINEVYSGESLLEVVLSLMGEKA